MTVPATAGASPPRSTFVTVLAWVAILFSGMGTLISALQNIMVATVFPREQLQAAMADSTMGLQIPPAMRFAFTHFQAALLLSFGVTALTLVAAIGLLRRQNWARLVFIVLLALGIGWNIIGVVVQQQMVSSLPKPPSDPRMPDFQTMMAAMRVVGVVIALAFGLLFGWLIAKLSSARIRGEFDRRPSAA